MYTNFGPHAQPAGGQPATPASPWAQLLHFLPILLLVAFTFMSTQSEPVRLHKSFTHKTSCRTSPFRATPTACRRFHLHVQAGATCALTCCTTATCCSVRVGRRLHAACCVAQGTANQLGRKQVPGWILQCSRRCCRSFVMSCRTTADASTGDSPRRQSAWTRRADTQRAT